MKNIIVLVFVIVLLKEHKADPYFGETDSAPSNQFVMTSLCSSISQQIYQAYISLSGIRTTNTRANNRLFDNPIRVSKTLFNYIDDYLFGSGWNGPFQNLARMITNFWSPAESLMSLWTQKNAQMESFFEWSSNYTRMINNLLNSDTASNISDILDSAKANTKILYQVVQDITNDSARNIIDSTNSQRLVTVLSDLLTDYTSFSKSVDNVTEAVKANFDAYILIDDTTSNRFVVNNNSMEYLQNLNRIATTSNINFWRILNSQFQTFSNSYEQLMDRTFAADPVVWNDWVNKWNKTHNQTVNGVNDEFRSIYSTIDDETYNFGYRTDNSYDAIVDMVVTDIGSYLRGFVSDVRNRLSTRASCLRSASYDLLSHTYSHSSRISNCVYSNAFRVFANMADMTNTIIRFNYNNFTRNLYDRSVCAYTYVRSIPGASQRARRCINDTMNEFQTVYADYKATRNESEQAYTNKTNSVFEDIEQCLTDARMIAQSNLKTINSTYYSCS